MSWKYLVLFLLFLHLFSNLSLAIDANVEAFPKESVVVNTGKIKIVGNCTANGSTITDSQIDMKIMKGSKVVKSVIFPRGNLVYWFEVNETDGYGNYTVEFSCSHAQEYNKTETWFYFDKVLFSAEKQNEIYVGSLLKLRVKFQKLLRV